ncbi:MAG: hypothetical protein QOI98_387 [Solirubrobacteraceae bacterium]|nr:hypothetical protein [Solirubrobacteraceae bacterium]
MSDHPASYLTLERGTPVVDRFGAPVGHVERVLTLSGPFFDGLIVSTRAGSRFVDAPEVRRIETDAVSLSITCADCEAPGLTSPVGVPAARWGRTAITDVDRREVIEALKFAYVNDSLTAHELGDRCEAAYTVATLDELDRLLP